MISHIERWAALRPGAAALFDDDSGAALGYGELAGLSRRMLARLAGAGLRPGDRVAALCHNCAEEIALFFACAHGGFSLCPLNWRLAGSELAAVLDDFAPSLLVYGKEFEGEAKTLGRPGLSLERLAGAAPLGPIPSRPGPTGVPLVLYTSGTTGRPKGALLSEAMLLANARLTAESWSLGAEDRSVVAAPLFHTGGWNVLTLPLLLCGGQITLLKKFEPGKVATLLRAGRASVLFGVPTMYQALLAEDIAGLRPKFFISGGAPCPERLVRAYQELGIVFLQGFGMTEVGPNCFYLPPGESVRKAGSVGLPMPGTEMRLAAEDGGPAGQSADSGELWIRGPHVFSGYLENSAETAKTLQDGWVRTGDLARRDEEGFYWILGRRKEMYISGGENVYPAEVEAALLAHPAVLEAAVIGIPDERWGEAGAAFVVPRPGAGLSGGEVLAFLDGRLARFKRPRELRVVDALPRNGMGKVQKSVLAHDAQRISLCASGQPAAAG